MQLKVNATENKLNANVLYVLNNNPIRVNKN